MRFVENCITSSYFSSWSLRPSFGSIGLFSFAGPLPLRGATNFLPLPCLLAKNTWKLSRREVKNYGLLWSMVVVCDVLWEASWGHSNERIMNWKQERARRIDISQPPFLIETISVPAIFFKHVPPTSYAKISAFGVFRKRVITKSWGCPQAVWLSFPDDPRGIKSGLVYPGWPTSLTQRGENMVKCVKRKLDSSQWDVIRLLDSCLWDMIRLTLHNSTVSFLMIYQPGQCIRIS